MTFRQLRKAVKQKETSYFLGLVSALELLPDPSIIETVRHSEFSNDGHIRLETFRTSITRYFENHCLVCRRSGGTNSRTTIRYIAIPKPPRSVNAQFRAILFRAFWSTEDRYTQSRVFCRMLLAAFIYSFVDEAFYEDETGDQSSWGSVTITLKHCLARPPTPQHRRVAPTFTGRCELYRSHLETLNLFWWSSLELYLHLSRNSFVASSSWSFVFRFSVVGCVSVMLFVVCVALSWYFCFVFLCVRWSSVVSSHVRLQILVLFRDGSVGGGLSRFETRLRIPSSGGRRYCFFIYWSFIVLAALWSRSSGRTLPGVW
jgi:hypothetical protein